MANDIPQQEGRAGGAIMAAIRGALAQIMPGVHQEIRATAQRESQQAGDALMGRIRREIDDATKRALERVDQAVNDLDAKLAEINRKLGVFDTEFESIMALGDQAAEDEANLPVELRTEPMVPYEAANAEREAEEAADHQAWLDDSFGDIDARLKKLESGTDLESRLIQRIQALEEKAKRGSAVYESKADLIHTGSAAEWADFRTRLAAVEIVVQWSHDEMSGEQGSGNALLGEAMRIAEEAAAKVS